MRQKRALPRRAAGEHVILFTVGGFRFAIAAAAVSEIRSMEGLERYFGGTGHKAAAKVIYTLERDGMTHFVVSAAQHFCLPPSRPDRVLILRHAAAAFLVDSTDRMVEISVLHALPLAFQGEERNWYRGLAIINGEAVPVVNPSAFLSRGEVAVLKAITEQTQQMQGATVG
ncbi:MAG TPA: chemotaxis protein CheW [Candidatus Angelobacter sp.]